MRKLVLLAMLAGASPVVGSAVSVHCRDDGSLDIHEVVSSNGTFRLHRRRGDAAPQPIGPEIDGVLSDYAPLYSAAGDGAAVIGSFVVENAARTIVWLADGATVVLDGRLAGAAVPEGGDIAAVVRTVPAGSEVSAVDAAIDRRGRIVGQRTLAWHSESGTYPALGMDHSLVYDRPVPFSSTEYRIELRDVGSLQSVGWFSFGDRNIEDAVVLSRRLAFFTAGGGVFKLEDGTITSIGGTDPQMRYGALDVDMRHHRLLARASGGHRVFGFDGSELSAVILGRPYTIAQGFSNDGHVIENAHPVRLRDAVTTVVVSELLDAPSPNSLGQRIACAFADRLVLVDPEGEIVQVPMTPVSGG
jgi:hypothetical protein